MKTSEKGIKLIKEFEGLALKAYKCPAGVLTIGYGHAGGVSENLEITKEEAEKLLKMDLKDFELVVNNFVKEKITQNQFDALVSFCYNVGAGGFQKSTLLKYINMQAFSQVPDQFMRWVKDGKGNILQGLVNRRRAEVMLWRGEI
jgi:lysozyme